MSRVIAKHNFLPMNPEKYVGAYPIVARSSWEWEIMNMCDKLSTILEWASEPHPIPYRDPVTNQQKVYIPDFLVTFLIGGEMVNQLIEIKPLKEAVVEAARGREDTALVARNNAKWEAAMAWCMRRGIEFRVMDETQLYSGQALSRKGTAISTWTPAQIKKSQLKQQRTKVVKAVAPKKHRMKVPGIRKLKGISRIQRRPK